MNLEPDTMDQDVCLNSLHTQVKEINEFFLRVWLVDKLSPAELCGMNTGPCYVNDGDPTQYVTVERDSALRNSTVTT